MNIISADKPLSQKRAIELGSNLLGDVIIFAVAEKKKNELQKKRKRKRNI
jgi:hypothetical protein